MDPAGETRLLVFGEMRLYGQKKIKRKRRLT
jgi:hypothetical protein